MKRVGALIVLAGVVVSAGAAATVGAAEQASPLPAATVVDCEHGDQLQTAIAGALAGATLWLAGTCRGNFHIDGVLRLRGLPTAALSAEGTGTALTVGKDADVGLSTLTILGGTGTVVGPKPATQIGGSVLNHGRLELRDVTVRGGYLAVNVVAEVGVAQGAGIWNDGWLVAQRSIVSGNEARALADEGGGLFNAGHAELVDSVVSANVASGLAGRGGGIFNALDAGLTLRRTRLEANTAAGRTGGGGGLYNAGTVSAEGGAIIGNTAGGLAVFGGGIANDGALALRRVDISSNQVAGSVGVTGAGLANRGSATLDRVWVTNNKAAGSVQPATGGGVASVAGTLVMRRGVVSQNTPTNCWPAELCPGELTEAAD